MSELNEEILNYLNTNSELNTLDYSKEKNLPAKLIQMKA